MMGKHMIASRGFGKTCLQHFFAIEELYRKNKIDKVEYLHMVAASRQAYFNETEEEVSKWIEEQLEEQE